MAGIILATSFEATMPAAAEAAPQQTEQTLSTGNMEISGTTNMGSLLAETMSEGYQELTENEGYSVFSIEMKDKTARVSLQAVKSCTLLVGLYDNTGAEMLTITSTDIEADQRTADAVFDIEQMPEYYFLRAFLIDTDTHRALSEKYECPLYTQKWQEFFSKTTDDFEPERVYNLDNDKTTNFGVFSDDIAVFSDETDVNKLVSYDNDKYVYVVENADESITSLTKGETVIFPIDNNDIVIVTVSSMSANGTTVVIQGSKPDLNNVFSYLRVEGQDDLEGAEVDTSEVPEFVQFDGIGDATCAVDSDTGAVSEILSDEEAANKSDGDPWIRTKTINYTFKTLAEGGYESESKNFKLKGSISGNASIWMKTTMDYNINGEDSFFELKTDYSNKCTFGVTGSIEGDIPLGEIPFTPVPGITVSITFYFCATAKGSINLELSYGGTIGYKLEHGKATNLSNQPKLNVQLEIAATVFIGLKFKFAISLLRINDDIKLGEIAVTARAGIEISGSWSFAPKENSEERHSCISCINGTWGFVVAVGVEGTVANIEGLTFSDEIRIPGFPTHDFYYSFDCGDHSISSKCPHKEYRITAYVHTTKNGKQMPVYNALISEEAHKLVKSTHYNGYITFYLEPGSYFFKAVKENYTKGLKRIAIKQATALDFEIEPVTGTINGFQYSVDSSNCATIVKYVGNQTLVKIPETIGGAPVTAIGYRAFMNSSVEGIQFNEGLKSIGNQAFLNCTRLRTVAFSKTITTVASNAFSGCENIVTASFAKDTKKIPNYAMNGCSSLKNVEIPRTVTEIGNYAFSGTALEMFLIHNGVKTLGNSAFANCKSLKKVSIPATLTSAGSEYGNPPFSGCSALTDVTFNKGITKIPESLLKDCTSITKITIPSTVQTIGDSAFQGSGLTSLSLPSSLKQIGRFAFSGIQIETLTLPEGVQSISDCAFSNCKSLKAVTIPTTLTSAGYYSYPTFSDCSALTNVTFNKGITQIPKYLLKDCTSITKITIPSTVQTIGDSAFLGTGLTSITLPSSIKYIGDYAFCGTPIETLTLPEGVQYIGSGAFGSCHSLKSVTIPTTLTSAGSSYRPIFTGCTALTDVTFNNGITDIPDELLKNCAGVTKITIPSTVKTIGSGAFCDTGLSAVSLPSGLTKIESSAFNGSKLTTVTIPAGVTSIGSNAFANCSLLSFAVINGEKTTVGSNAFNNCSSSLVIACYAGSPAEKYAKNNNIKYSTIGDASYSSDQVIYDYPDEEFTDPDSDLTNDQYTDESTSQTEEPGLPTIDPIVYENYWDFEGLTAGETYNFYAVESREAESLFAPANMLYIEQFTADENGCASVGYTLARDIVPEVFVVQMSPYDISDADISVRDMVCTGDTLIPSVKVMYEDTELRLGIDYDVSGEYLVTEAGTYSLTVKGLDNYGGTAGVSYNVLPAEQKTVAAIEIVTEPLKKEYYIGQQFTGFGGRLKLYYDNNYEEETEFSSDIAVEFNSETAGEKTVIVNVGDADAEFTVTVVEKDKNKPFVTAEAGNGRVKLSWTAVENAEKYSVFQYGAEGFEEIAGDITNTTFTVDSLANDTEYMFAVKAYVNGVWTELSAADYTAATPFVDISPKPVAIPGDGEVKLKWEAIPDAEMYSVSIVNETEISPCVSDLTATEYVVKELTNGTEYKFLVRAFVNGEWSRFSESNYVSATPAAALKVTNVRTEPMDGAVKVTWDSLDGAEMYRVYKYLNDTYTRVFTGNASATSTVVNDLTNGTRYGFAVTAKVNGAWTVYSELVYEIPVSENTVLPLQNVAATAGDGQVTISWDAVANAEMYRVFTVSDAVYKRVYSGDAGKTTTVITGLTNGVEYGFAVTAKANGIWSDYSEIAYATPVAVVKPTIIGYKVGDAKVKLQWSPINGAEMYRVYYYLDGVYTRAFTASSETTVATVTGLTGGTEYGFVVSAKVNGTWTNYTDKADLVYATPTGTAKPSIVAYKAGNYKVKLEWRPVDGTEMYRVYTYENGNYTRKFTCSGSRNIATVTGLVSGVKYGFVVSAKVNGTWTNYTDASDLVYTAPTGTPAPVITGYKTGDSKVKLEWYALDGAEMYRVYSLLNGVYKREFTTTDSTVATVSGLTNGQEYGFVVSAKVNGVWTGYKVPELILYATPNA